MKITYPKNPIKYTQKNILCGNSLYSNSLYFQLITKKNVVKVFMGPASPTNITSFYKFILSKTEAT